MQLQLRDFSAGNMQLSLPSIEIHWHADVKGTLGYFVSDIVVLIALKF